MAVITCFNPNDPVNEAMIRGYIQAAKLAIKTGHALAMLRARNCEIALEERGCSSSFLRRAHEQARAEIEHAARSLRPIRLSIPKPPRSLP